MVGWLQPDWIPHELSPPIHPWTPPSTWNIPKYPPKQPQMPPYIPKDESDIKEHQQTPTDTLRHPWGVFEDALQCLLMPVSGARGVYRIIGVIFRDVWPVWRCSRVCIGGLSPCGIQSGAGANLVSFTNPLASGSGLVERTPKKVGF